MESTINDIIMGKARTAGDGMESEENATEAKAVNKSTTTFVAHKKKEPLSKGRLIQVFAVKTFIAEKKNNIYSKTPKFVPYEPYPAAVKPMNPKSITLITKKSRNHMDLNTLVNQMSQMNTNLNEFRPRLKNINSSNDKVEENPVYTDEMQKKVEKLMRENESLSEQLKQQVQVNKELKTMLVASMGEDLETQVQSLTEDKKHLADALINSAQHLSTHQEQTEWLAGQCEVWRSKFLASSLLIEELAACKKILNEKTINLQQGIKQLLDERCRARDMMLCTYKNLYSLHEKWLENITVSEYMGNKLCNRPIGNLNFNATMPRSTNILDMSSVNMKLSENISSDVSKQDITHLDSLPTITDGEKFAEQVMSMPVDMRKLSEEPVNALVQHAYTSGGNVTPPVAACVHCNGKVQLL